MKYIVSFVIAQYQGDGIHTYSPQGRTLIIQANSKAQAFMAAYEQLTIEGHLVCTVNPTDGVKVYDGIRDEIRHAGVAGLTGAEMEEVYRAGVPRNSPNQNITMTHINEIREFTFAATPSQPTSNANGQNLPFIDFTRLEQLKAIGSSKFDLSRLVKLCEELDTCYTNRCYFAVAMLTRAILDHVPPIFGYSTFAEIVNNYSGTKSFKEQMEHLQNSSRRIADSYLHTRVRGKESLPGQVQVNFSNDVDVLLAEVIRILQ